jgi:transposase
MLYQDYTKELLGIKDVIVTDIKHFVKEIHISIELPRKEHICPCCNSSTSSIHDYRIQIVKEVSILSKYTFFHFRKRRYVCKSCNKKFYEQTPFFPRYHRMTSRLIEFIIEEMKSIHSLLSIAKRANVSVPTICRVFKYINYTNTKLPKVLSIDEFKGNTATGKYQCIITDPHHKKVLDILKTRNLPDLIDYSKKFPNRKEVQFFVMDMWKPYKDIAETYFKNATIVIDKYHFIMQVLWAFERVRKEEQKKFSKVRRIYFKRSKRLLLKRMSKLKPEDKDAVEIMLQTSEKLRNAYLLKEKFYEFVDSKDLSEAKKNLTAWYLYIGVCKIPEFEQCFKTINNWQKYILNSFTCTYTNGFTEGVNNKIKVIKRNAYGVRNFERFRNRILHVLN